MKLRQKILFYINGLKNVFIFRQKYDILTLANIFL